MNTKLDIASKVSAARNALNASVADFEEKNAAFQKVRKTYAEVLESQAALTQKITDLEAQIEAATAEFKSEFQAANYEHTAAVKKVLVRRNDAQAMLEEVQAVLPNVEREILIMKMDGGPEAKRLIDARNAIKTQQIKLHILDAVSAIPQEIKDALVLAAESFPGNGEMNFVWAWLAETAKESGTAPTLSNVADLSVLPYKSEDFNWRQLNIDSAKAKLNKGISANEIVLPKRIPEVFYQKSN